METLQVATLSLRWFYQLTLSASFWDRLKFEATFPFDLASVLETVSEYFYFLFHLIHSSND